MADSSQSREERDTDRPVAGGDAYGAETVLRQIPDELMAKVREAKEASKAKALLKKPAAPPRPPKEAAKSGTKAKVTPVVDASAEGEDAAALLEPTAVFAAPPVPKDFGPISTTRARTEPVEEEPVDEAISSRDPRAEPVDRASDPDDDDSGEEVSAATGDNATSPAEAENDVEESEALASEQDDDVDADEAAPTSDETPASAPPALDPTPKADELVKVQAPAQGAPLGLVVVLVLLAGAAGWYLSSL